MSRRVNTDPLMVLRAQPLLVKKQGFNLRKNGAHNLER